LRAKKSAKSFILNALSFLPSGRESASPEALLAKLAQKQKRLRQIGSAVSYRIKDTTFLKIVKGKISEN